jgi:hypothetical protein
VNLKKEVEAYNDNEKPSLWLADLLWTLADDLEDIEGTSKSFL